MIPDSHPRASISWNGGRYGWRSFLVGANYVPPFPGMGDHVLHVHLGLWVATFRRRAKDPT